MDLPATGTDAASDITNSKTYISAVDYGPNVGAPVSTNVVVNGVTLYHYGIVGNISKTTNQVDSIHGGRVVLSVGGPSNPNLQTQNNPGQGAVATQADGSMRLMLSDLDLSRSMQARLATGFNRSSTT